MAHSVTSRTSSPANDLRDALKEAEDQLVKPSPDQVEPLLILLDKIDFLFDSLDMPDLDLRPEDARRVSLHNRLLSKPSLIVSPARAVGGLAALRAKQPSAKGFWWHLDKTLNQRRSKSLRRLLITAVTVIGLLGLAYFIVDTFFPPSPEALIVLEATNSIEPDLLAQDWAAARQKIETGIEAAPEESELWIWHVVLSEQLGDNASAEASLDKARALVDNEERLLVGLAQTRLQIGDLDGAEEAAQQVLTLDAESALGTFILANVAEAQGDIRTAINLFEEASNLAADTNAQLSVISRMRMGTLMQSAPGFPAAPAADDQPDTSNPDQTQNQ